MAVGPTWSHSANLAALVPFQVLDVSGSECYSTNRCRTMEILMLKKKKHANITNIKLYINKK